MKSAGPDRVEDDRARRRRFWSEEEKRRIVAEFGEPGASASVVAQRHGLNANLLFTWRRQLRDPPKRLPGEGVTLLPVTVAPEPSATSGRMEIVLLGGERISFGADVDAGVLVRIVKALRR